MKLTLSFLSSSFATWPKSQDKNFKYLENKKSFWGEIKSIFHNFQRAFSCQKLSQTWKYTFKALPSSTCSLLNFEVSSRIWLSLKIKSFLFRITIVLPLSAFCMTKALFSIKFFNGFIFLSGRFLSEILKTWCLRG